MNHIYRTLRNSITTGLTTALVVSLSACGGGGSSGTPATSPATTLLPSTTTTTTTTTTTAVDYAAVAAQLTTIRSGSGAGMLSQNIALDSAAKKHAAFMVDNKLVSNIAYLDTLHEGILGGHYEDPALSGVVGFTGKTPQDRATAVGYVGTVSELIVFGSANGADCLTSFENSVYHLAQLMSPFTEVGLNFNAGSSASVCVIELSTGKGTGQLPADGSVVIYPYAGQTAVFPTFYNQAEAPLPVSDLNVAGHPIMVSLLSQSSPALQGSDIVLQTFALSTVDGKSVAARILARAGTTSTGPLLSIDGNLVSAGTVFLVPTAPLLANTLYRVSFAATVKGKAVSKDWSFTTGNAN